MSGATYSLENPRVAGFSRSIVAIDNCQTDTVERQPLVGNPGVDMSDPMHLPQIDRPLIAVRAAKVPRFQGDCRVVALADGSRLINLGRLPSRLRC